MSLSGIATTLPELVPLFVLQFVMSLAAYTAIGGWFVRPWLRSKPVETALAILLLPQLLRHVGITLMVGEVVDPSFPVEMARRTAIGDTLTALFAWAALIALRLRWRRALALVWVFNLFGLADMLTNLASGLRLQVADDLGAAWLGIVFVVPLMLVVHGLIFAFLLEARRAALRS
jgi:hypothetical protein